MDLTYEAFKMAGALAVVVLILLGGLAWVRRTFGDSPGLGGDPVMRVLGGLRVGAGKHIMLVDVAGEVLVLGTTAKDMTLLTKITDEARTDHMRAQVNPVASRIGTWMGQWARPDSEKTASSSLVQSSPVRITKC
ncbi:MAG: flagellar biosynthetic protein FliO [Nitrospirota bacterium]|nr:flagellar biosynthetic protein FliO [Nitrospirota bacterium]MDH5587282.1 flagellar biosynthetic protein FliO [Nitrospirota bacterium]MDH5775183.1 flagellar biosynthetic protein FliO [Nitrospirota bacterium]